MTDLDRLRTDIGYFAKVMMGLELFVPQIQLIEAWEKRRTVIRSRRAGTVTAARVFRYRRDIFPDMSTDWRRAI